MTKFAFLDRDGVLVRFPGRGKYVVRESQMKLIRRSADAVKLLSDAGFRIAVISNQGCVSRGMITSAWLKRMTKKMLKQLHARGGKISGVYYCEHQTSDRCACKKPKIGLVKKAVKGLRVDKKASVFIGDSDVDVEAGKKYGCRTGLVLTGRTKRAEARAFGVKPDRVYRDLWEAAKWLTKKY
jgi:D-glycero-D-manno-heptose 1,7-bisphosphate phosphatase